MKRTNQLMLAVAMCTMLGMPLAHAEGPGGGDPTKGFMKGMGGREDKVLEQLGLTPEQKTALNANRDQQMGEIKGLLKGMMDLSEQLNDELMKEKMDMTKVNQLNNDLKAIQGKMADKRISFIMDVRKNLTPEQFAKFIKLTEERRKERMQRRSEKMEK